MKPLSKLLMICSAFTLAACGGDDYTGTLTAKEPLKLKLKKESLDLPQGIYATGLKGVKGGVQFNIEVNGDKKAVKFKLAEGQSIDGESREIAVPAEANGQEYDLALARKTETGRTGPHRNSESCTYHTTEHRCWMEDGGVSCHTEGGGTSCSTVRECDPQNPSQCETRRVCHDTPGREVCHSRPDRRVCGDISVAHSGDRDVEYFVNGSVTTVLAQLRKPGTDVSVADFIATRDNGSSRDYVFRGTCR